MHFRGFTKEWSVRTSVWLGLAQHLLHLKKSMKDFPVPGLETYICLVHKSKIQTLTSQLNPHIPGINAGTIYIKATKKQSFSKMAGEKGHLKGCILKIWLIMISTLHSLTCPVSEGVLQHFWRLRCVFVWMGVVLVIFLMLIFLRKYWLLTIRLTKFQRKKMSIYWEII